MIFSLFFISFFILVRNDKIHEYNKMNKGIEKSFTNLNNSSIYHFSIDVDKNDCVEIQIKLNSSFTINDIKVNYFADTSTKPTTKLEDEGQIILSQSNDNSFLNLKGSYIVSKSFIYYVSFLVEPLEKNIDIMYVSINKESTNKGLSGLQIIVLILSIILAIVIIFIIALLSHRYRKRKEITFSFSPTFVEKNIIPQLEDNNKANLLT